HPVQQENIAKLKALGNEIIEPDEGFLACGTSGKGRLGSIDMIEETILTFLKATDKPQDLAGKSFLISAGPTIEPIDPVRYITNRSSGKMGYALAKAAISRGAKVTLVSGTVNIQPPPKVKVVNVISAQEMAKAMAENYEAADIVIMAAAVADYRVAAVATEKIKKSETEMTLKLVKNDDILANLGAKKQHQYLVGFAAETSDIKENALNKLKKKNLNMIVANDVTQKGAGFDVDTNIVTIYTNDNKVLNVDLTTKENLANIILEEILNKL
ncbi:MAG: bifunctional phosphopantothenoylcysteine decarboxylase/phosphopantothenate--cysteine ligase CoaBC, partial [Clostridiales bacterium]